VRIAIFFAIGRFSCMAQICGLRWAGLLGGHGVEVEGRWIDR
jgi:hypothetical protein